ncbi:hypothetical protein VSQ48_19470 [Candidatus Ventrimonas sp. KK005]|nr:hypothetical protein [Clostridiaceae bacterium]
MNNRKYIINSLSYMTIFNIFSMLITAFSTLFLPRFTNLYNYSLWQLFIFYYGYLGFFHLGWNDGIYIKYGGYKYSELNQLSLFLQFWLLIIFQFFCACTILFLFKQDSIDRRFILYLLAVNLVILNSRYMLVYVLQATARIKEYAIVLFLDRCVYIIIVVGAVITKQLNFKWLVIAETLGKISSFVLAVCFCKSIVINSFFKLKCDFLKIFNEIKENIDCGIKIMFSNVASILIIGINRFGIEKNWGVEIFGQISLSITISQLFITFVTNIGMILFPLLRKMKEESLVHTYQLLKLFLDLVVFFLFLFFYIGRWILLKWIPLYELSIQYMGLLIPICLYESEMALLNNIYLKSMRKEKTIMWINCCVMILACLFTYIFSFWLQNLLLSVFSITVLIWIRCLWSEYILNRQLNMGYHILFNLENLMVGIYIVAIFIFGDIYGFIVYLVCYVAYVSIKYIKKHRSRNVKY